MSFAWRVTPAGWPKNAHLRRTTSYIAVTNNRQCGRIAAIMGVATYACRVMSASIAATGQNAADTWRKRVTAARRTPVFAGRAKANPGGVFSHAMSGAGDMPSCEEL